jgi:hypothetical protein
LLVLLGDIRFMGPCIVSIFQYIYPARRNVTQFIYIWKLLYMFRVVLPPFIRSAYNCIYSIWYLSHRYCYLPLSWKSWNRFESAVGGVRHPTALPRVPDDVTHECKGDCSNALSNDQIKHGATALFYCVWPFMQLEVIYEGNSISKLQIQVATYVFELSAENCHR